MKNIKRVTLIICALGLLSVFIINLGITYYPELMLLDRFNPEYMLSSSSLEFRLRSYPATYNLLKDFPLFGTGFVNIFLSYQNITMSHMIVRSTIDNAYLELLGYSGIIGFLSFMLFLAKNLVDIRRKLKTFKTLKIYPILFSLYCAILGMLIASFGFWSFGQLTTSLTFWTFVGILASVSRIHPKNKAAANE